VSGFKGQYVSTLDTKGRVAVPVKLRRNTPDGVADRFVITKGLDGCLFLFTPDYWERVTERLDEIPFTQHDAKYFTRQLLSHAEDVELDRQSRIRVPQKLIDTVHLEREALFIGVLRRIEIWRPETYEKYLQEFDESYEDVAAKLLL